MSEILSHPVFAIVLMLGILVFVHELGHYIVAKLLGVGVEAFSIGFGPSLLSFTYHNTKYQIAWIPLGGFVKLAGTLPSEKVPKCFQGMEMYKAPNWGRALILFAGPFANLVLAASAYCYLGSQGIHHRAAVVGSVRHDSPAEEAGLLPADKILQIDGKEILTWEDMTKVIKGSSGIPLELLVKRENKQKELVLTPKSVEVENFLGKKEIVGRIGIGYGFLSPVVAVLDRHSLASKQGLRTGDHIIEIRYQDSQGEAHEIAINTWNQFLRNLGKLYQEEIFSLKLTTKNFRGISEKEENKTIALTIPKGSFAGLDSSKDRYLFELGSALVKKLGLTNSQLTIYETKNPVSKSLKPFDHLLAFNGKEIRDHYDLYEYLEDNKEPKVSLTVNRQGKIQVIVVELNTVDRQKASGKEVIYTLDSVFLGEMVPPVPVIEKYTDPISALSYGVTTTWNNSGYIFESLLGLFSGQVPLQSLGGPILIAKLAGDSAKAGWDAFIRMLAMISINLAIINLFPIPILDGGQLLMVAYESVRRRPLSAIAFENFQKIGFVLILSLVVLSTYNDLSRFWASMFKEVVRFFE